MDQAANGSIPQSAIDQPARTRSTGPSITALAERHAHLFHVVSDEDRDEGEVEAVLTMILCGKPQSLDESRSMLHVVEVELDTMEAEKEASPVIKRLLRAVKEIGLSMEQHGSASSPMTVW